MKTISLKKVAVVAVASLGFGLLSVVPANAASNNNSIVPNASISTIQVTAPTAPTAGATAAFTIGVTTGTAIVGGTTDTFKIKATITSAPTGGISGFTGAVATSGLTAEQINVSSGAGLLSVGADGTTGFPAGTYTLGTMTFTPAKAGTYNISFYHDQSADGTLSAGEKYQTATITVGASTNAASSSLSTAWLGAGTTKATTTDALSVSGAKTAAGQVANIDVLVKTPLNAVLGSATVRATIAGPGYVTAGAHATNVHSTCGTTRTVDQPSEGTNGHVSIAVCGDGTAGVATVTVQIVDPVSAAVLDLGTKKVTFYGDVTKIAVVTTNYKIGKAGGGNTGYYNTGTVSAKTAADRIPAFVVKTTDAAGNAATAASTVSGLTSLASVLSGATCQEDDGTSLLYSSGGKGFYNCYFTTPVAAKSGDKATLTFRVLDPIAADGTYLTATAVDITIGGTKVVTETIAFDKTSYAPGEAMVITRTAKDSDGNPVADETASPAITFSKAIGGTAPTTSIYVGGISASATSVAKSGVFAPALGGAFSALATSGNAAASALTASATVTDANAGLMTQIDALNAKIVALNALIAKIMKKLGVK